MTTITIPMLKHYNSCEQGIKYFARFYPDGATTEVLLNDRHLPKDMVQWGLNHLPLDEEDIRYCHAKLNLINCFNTKDCVDCKNSTNIFGAHDVSDSSLIYHSSAIKKSSLITRSRNITESEECADSNSIINSNRIFSCNNIKESWEISRSTFTSWSTGVIDSLNISNSQLIRKSKHLKSCMFCAESENLVNCFGCYGLTSGENLAFNQEVGKEMIEMLRDSLIQLDVISKFKVADEWVVGRSVAPKPFYDYRLSYKLLGDDFYEWLKQCPIYDEQIKYNITAL